MQAPAIFRRTLVRRVSLTLMLSFGVVYVAYMGLILRQASAPEETVSMSTTRADNLLASIASARTTGAACSIAMAAVEMLNQDRGMTRNTYGALSGPEQCATPGWPVKPGTDGVLQVGEKSYVAVTRKRGRWTLSLAVEQRSKGWLFSRINQTLAPYLIASFIIILIPIWWAVARGLRPLRALSDRIAARSPDDLQPLRAPASYAELTPLTDALDALLAQLRRKVEREHAFVQDAAHELRTPLAAISVQAHAVAALDDKSERAQAARQLDAVIRRASHLIDQLLELARLGNDKSSSTSFDLAELVRDEAAMVAPLAIQRDIELTVDGDERVPLLGDRASATAIISNLLSNALRYTPPGGHVTATVQASATETTLTVSDTGPGIPPELRDLVFERFYRASADVAGTGLGLAIVREAAARLCGRVTVAASPAGGALFVVYIPQGSGLA
ncbi:sensor histidine kinase [Zemynaea arenosa]|nr:ATP-binding protein [Massilia arenosa]